MTPEALALAQTETTGVLGMVSRVAWPAGTKRTYLTLRPRLRRAETLLERIDGAKQIEFTSRVATAIRGADRALGRCVGLLAKFASPEAITAAAALVNAPPPAPPAPVPAPPVVQTLTAGSGFTGATSQPAAIGSGAGSDARAMARWDVVPWQTVRGTFDIGVVAFHMNGIDRVEFSLDGGTWRVANTMTLNATSGAREYTVRMDASTLADGQHEIRAIAYPTVGIPRVLQGTLSGSAVGADCSMFLYTNTNNTLAEPKVYADSARGSDSTGDGTETRPYQTIHRAAIALNSLGGSTEASGGTVYLKAGSYSLVESWPDPSSPTRWMTITPAPGVASSACPINGGGNGLKTHKLRLLNMQIVYPGAIATSNFGNNWLWADHCDFDLGDRAVKRGPAGGFSGMWFTECTNRNCAYAFQGMSLVRNCSATMVGENGFGDSLLVVNSSIDNINRDGADYHPDVCYHQSPQSTENVILYGVRVTRATNAQGVFAKQVSSINNIAYVNVLFESGNSDIATPQVNHMILWNCSFVGNGNWNWGTTGTPTVRNLSVKGTVFNGMNAIGAQLNSSWFDQVHYVNGSGVPGNHVTTGNAGFTDAANSDFRPTTTSVLKNRLALPLVPIDATGSARSGTATIGALE